MIEAWLSETIDDFWAAAGEIEPFPRNLEAPVLWALPLAVVRLPQLWIKEAEAWLERRSIHCNLDETDRPLRGCLVAFRGRGFVLLDGTDPDDERRFSLAHEVSHFLVEYLIPRRRALEKLGEGILDVLDGIRPPTVDERIDAVLNDAPVGVHAHLMGRHPDGLPDSEAVLKIESRADRVALELLAPADEVRHRIVRLGPQSTVAQRRSALPGLLADEFGLPLPAAETYGAWLITLWHGTQSLREWLGM